jgi:uncharacterized protein YegJ (DUF2314 family)
MAEIIPVEGDNAEMNAAMDEARRRLPEFRKALEADWQRMIPVIDRPFIKAQFASAETGEVEHMWVEVREFDGDLVIGELANDPNEIPELSQGDEVRVPSEEVSDWIYYQGEETVGGFTLALLNRREEKAAGRKSGEDNVACSRYQSANLNDRDARDRGMPTDLQFVDDYLEKWDRFSQGENQLVPQLRDNRARFEAALVGLLLAGDKGAPARMVFYPVVQVGGAIPVESELGKASAEVLGPDFVITTRKDGQREYFAGDLYFWWEANRNKFDAHPLFDEWKKREFAKTVVVPMYESTSKRG